jgi:hypothetical protein
MVTLVCGHRGARRPVTVFVAPWPLPPHYWPRGPHTTLDLNCRYCGLAPRLSDAGLRALLEVAAGQPRRRLDISRLDVSRLGSARLS